MTNTIQKNIKDLQKVKEQLDQIFGEISDNEKLMEHVEGVNIDQDMNNCFNSVNKLISTLHKFL